MPLDRRTFMKQVALGGCTIISYNYWGCTAKQIHHPEHMQGQLFAILADYVKCTGCRTCECVCSSFNRRQDINGQSLAGLGNPYYSNIQVTAFNPDIDVPTVCAMCSDAPCVSACPVEPDLNGEKALYKDKKTATIKCYNQRCIGCGSCKDACESKGVGIIRSNLETNMPERMCTLCDGDPECVKHCPGGALAFVRVDINHEFYRLNSVKVAERLTEKWYNMKQGGA